MSSSRRVPRNSLHNPHSASDATRPPVGICRRALHCACRSSERTGCSVGPSKRLQRPLPDDVLTIVMRAADKKKIAA